MEKIYTSRYANSRLKSDDVIKVGITRGLPKFGLKYQLAKNIIEFAPSYKIFHLTSKEDFSRAYKLQLDTLGREKAMELLKEAGYGGEKPLVLLCYEDLTCDDPKKNWCHRTYLAEWLRDKLGIEVEEYPDDNCFAMKEQKKAEKEAEKEARRKATEKELENQLSLF